MPLTAEQLELSFDAAASDEALLASMPQRMRSDQVAEVLNCTTEHVRQLREKKALMAVDIRSPGSLQATYRFYKEQVAQYLAKLRNDEPQ